MQTSKDLQNNETLGISTEYLICKKYNLNFPLDPKRVICFPNLQDILYQALESIEEVKEYEGYKNDEHDFILKSGRTLSVKTNYRISNPKVCPQNIGQTSKNKFISYFKDQYQKISQRFPTTRKIEDNIKDCILDNPSLFLNEYLINLFQSDILLWIFGINDKKFQYLIIDKEIIKIKEIFQNQKIKFTRMENWNESNTVKIDSVSIGEFQIHNNRNCIKFRFNLVNLLKILNKDLSDKLKMKRVKNEKDNFFKLNYIGSKKLLLTQYKPIFDKYLVNCKSFADLFCGSGIVSEFIKSEYPNISEIIINDLNEYATTITTARLENVDEKELEIINEYIENINKQTKEGFFYHNYCNKYFTESNCKKIDGMLDYIEEIIDDTKVKNFLKALLICTADSVSNTSCVYGAYLKKIKKSAEKSLELPKINNYKSKKINVISNTGDILEFINDKKLDVVYLDPPYNARQYGSNYHILETICKNDKPELSGKTGLRPYLKSSFCNKDVEKSFRKLINTLKCNTLIMSYNNDGILSKDKIKEILSEKGELEIFEIPYKNFKSNSKTIKKDIIEYLFCCKFKN